MSQVTRTLWWGSGNGSDTSDCIFLLYYTTSVFSWHPATDSLYLSCLTSLPYFRRPWPLNSPWPGELTYHPLPHSKDCLSLAGIYAGCRAILCKTTGGSELPAVIAGLDRAVCYRSSCRLLSVPPGRTSQASLAILFWRQLTQPSADLQATCYSDPFVWFPGGSWRGFFLAREIYFLPQSISKFQPNCNILPASYLAQSFLNSRYCS